MSLFVSLRLFTGDIKKIDMQKSYSLLALIACFGVTLATYGVDVSQYTSSSVFRCLKGRGFSFAIIRGYQSNGRPDSNVVNNINNAWAGGMSYVDVYFFPCYHCGNAAGQVQDFLKKVSGAKFGMVWLDIEGSAYWSSSTTSNINFINELIQDLKARTSHSIGIYSSYYNWHSLTGNTNKFASQVPIWYAHYDGSPSFSDWQRLGFGGWTKPSIKQYVGDATECGAGIDKNYY